MSRRSRKRQQNTERAREWILRNQDASIARTIEATGISYGTVTALRRELRNAGLLGVYPHTPGNGAEADPPQTSAQELYITTAPVATEQAEREVDAIVMDVSMTRESRRQRLEYFVKFGTPDHAIRANAAIEAMDRADSKIDDSGPPIPSTIDEGIAEVADMVEALMVWGGEEAVKHAVTIGMGRVFRDRKAEEPIDVKPNEPTTPAPDA